MSALRLRHTASAVILALLAVWAFAPVLLFLGLLAVALGLLCAAMIGLARRLQAWRERR